MSETFNRQQMKALTQLPTTQQMQILTQPLTILQMLQLK